MSDVAMVVPSIVPPLMSALVAVKLVIVVAAIVPPSTLSPEIWSSAKVKVPDETSRVLPAPTVISEVAIVAPSIVPPLMSAVSAIKLSMFAVPSM